MDADLDGPRDGRDDGPIDGSDRDDTPASPVSPVSPAVNESLPELVRPVAFLLGGWRGSGVGAVPGDAADFPYDETVHFSCDGWPWLEYWSRVTAADDGRLLFAETGWLRPQPPEPDGTVPLELVLIRPTGIAEVLLGHCREGAAGAQVELASDVVARTPSAVPITADKRIYAVRGGKLMYAVDLAAGDGPLTPHLAAALDPIESQPLSG